MIEESPCTYSARLREKIMEANVELTTVDQSVYGLVVFLVIFLLFATLTSGLLVCLTKIWCGFKQERRRPSQLTEKQRQSILRSPAFGDDDDSEEESVQHTLSSRRFSQRIMSYVHKSLGDGKPKDKDKENALPDRLSPSIYGADHGIPLPTICTIEASTSNLHEESVNHDPTTIVHV